MKWQNRFVTSVNVCVWARTYSYFAPALDASRVCVCAGFISVYHLVNATIWYYIYLLLLIESYKNPTPPALQRHNQWLRLVNETNTQLELKLIPVSSSV